MSVKQKATLTNHLSEEALRTLAYGALEEMAKGELVNQPDAAYILSSFIERIENTVTAGYASIKAYQEHLTILTGVK